MERGKMSATEAIRELIERQLQAIEAEVEALHDALRRLESNGSEPAARDTSRRGRVSERRAVGAPSNGRTRARGRAERAPGRGSVTAGRVQQLLREHSDLSTAAVAEGARVGRDDALRALKELEARGEVRRSGQRRGVRWHAVTDEDRIRERAAQLEQQSRSRRAAAKP